MSTGNLYVHEISGAKLTVFNETYPTNVQFCKPNICLLKKKYVSTEVSMFVD